MDATDVILTALEAGAVSATKDVADQTIREAYQHLRDLLGHRLKGKPEAVAALATAGDEGVPWKELLKQALADNDIRRDGEIVRAAQELLTLASPKQAAQGKYNLQIAGNVQGLAQGDFQQTKMTFGKALDDEL